MQDSKFKLKYDLIAFIGYLIIVTILSQMPADIDAIPPFPHFDKLIHIVFYLGFSWFLGRLVRHQGQARLVWKVLIPTVCYSILMEGLQDTFDLGRHFDIFDIIANIIGALIGTILIYQSVSVRKR